VSITDSLPFQLNQPHQSTRICPGRYSARDVLFVAITSIMHVFKIGKAVDGNGVEITPQERWHSGLVS